MKKLSVLDRLLTPAILVCMVVGVLIGNYVPGVQAAFDTARRLTEARPRVILFDTLMGKGVPFLETREKNHFIRVDPPEWQQAIDILDQAQGAAR